MPYTLSLSYYDIFMPARSALSQPIYNILYSMTLYVRRYVCMWQKINELDAVGGGGGEGGKPRPSACLYCLQQLNPNHSYRLLVRVLVVEVVEVVEVV